MKQTLDQRVSSRVFKILWNTWQEPQPVEVTDAEIVLAIQEGVKAAQVVLDQLKMSNAADWPRWEIEADLIRVERGMK